MTERWIWSLRRLAERLSRRYETSELDNGILLLPDGSAEASDGHMAIKAFGVAPCLQRPVTVPNAVARMLSHETVFLTPEDAGLLLRTEHCSIRLPYRPEDAPPPKPTIENAMSRFPDYKVVATIGLDLNFLGRLTAFLPKDDAFSEAVTVKIEVPELRRHPIRITTTDGAVTAYLMQCLLEGDPK